MKIRRDEMIPALVLIMFVGIIMFMMYMGEDILGLTTDDTITLMYLFPGVIAFFVSILGVSRAGAGAQTFIAVIGVAIAFVYSIYVLNEVGILIPDLEMAVTDLMILIFFVFLVIGAGFAVVKRR